MKPPLRIVLTGPESTGKTTLARRLAEHFRTVWVQEYAREYLQERPGPYSLEDLEIIARTQRARQEGAARRANRLLFCDTDLLVIKIWAEYRFGTSPEWVEKRLRTHPPDLFLLCQPDLPWEPDPLRENPHDRPELFQRYHRTLLHLGTPFEIVHGEGEERLARAIRCVKSRLPLSH